MDKNHGITNIGIDVFWVSKCSYIPGFAIPMHNHDLFHYIYVAGGGGNIKIGIDDYPLFDDELFMIPSKVVHCFTADNKSGLKTIEVKFEVKNKDLFDKLNSMMDYRCRFDDLKVRHLLENIICEGTNKSIYYKDIINLKFLEVLLNLARRFEKDHSNMMDPLEIENIDIEDLKSIKATNSSLKETLLYMERNLESKLDLDGLARYCKMNRYHFNKLFNSNYGIPPIQYLNMLRLAKAKELLKYSELNITQIASVTGFSDIHYFSHYFKSKENMSPMQYMKNNRSNVYIYMETDSPDIAGHLSVSK